MTDSVDTCGSSLRDVVAFRDDISAFFRRLRSERGDHKLTPSQLQALGHLERQGSMSARELAGYEQVTPQSIARTLAVLEEGAMVIRVPDPSDGRASLVSITEHGHKMLEADRALRSAWLAELLDRECTPHERDVLLLAGRIMRDLGRRPARDSGEPHP